MGAEVFHLKNSQYRRQSSTKSNPNPNLNRSGGRKRSSGRNTTTVDNPSPAKSLVMEQVKILKRGEALDDKTNTNIISTLLLKGDDEKSKSLGKLGDRRGTPLKKKDDKKVKFEGVVKKVVVEMKDVKKKDDKKVKFEGDVKEVEEDLKDELVLSSTDRLGPGPEMVPKVHDFHAGLGVDSPSPSLVPLPSFFTKKSDPTMDLIRMLRLNL